MYRVNLLILVALIYSMPAFSMTQNIIKNSNLYGSWNCKHELKEPKTKMKVNINYNITYAATGNSQGVGNIWFSLEGMPSLQYTIKNTSTWKIKDKILSMSSNNMTFVNTSHPELDKFLNIKTLLPKQGKRSTNHI